MISVIMVAYEVAPYVKQAIDSVLAQDYENIELILVATMGGRDNCYEICKECAATDERIKLVTIPAAKGVADARNQGLKAVTGDYLAFVDGDDYIEKDMLSSMLSNINNYSADIAVCGRFYEYENATLEDAKSEIKVYTADEALSVVLSNEGFFLHCWDKLYSRVIFKDLHFREDMYVEDRIVVNRLLGSANRVVYDSTPKYHFRERSKSLSKVKNAGVENIKANMILQEYIMKEHQTLEKECDRFMLYEYITAVQNELVAGGDRKSIRPYIEQILMINTKNNAFIGRSLKVKRMMALYCPSILRLYTRTRQTKTANELKRFQ